MNWYLNRFLTSWRDAANQTFPTRSKASDGTIGDLRHQGGYSEHNPDRDLSVDAWDMDVNLYASSNPKGNAKERAAIEQMKRDFERLPQSQLWIHDGEIANRDIGNWQRRPYKGANPHDKHVHWQSRSSMEKLAVSLNVLADNIVSAINQPMRLVAVESSSIPKWPHSKAYSLDLGDRYRYSSTTEKAQRRLKERGWNISIDGYFGPQTDRIVRLFQAEKGLKRDGKLGPKTWAALWLEAITA